jgi:hypothetical protein
MFLVKRKQVFFFVVASKALKNMRIGASLSLLQKRTKGQSQRRKSALPGAGPGFTASR